MATDDMGTLEYEAAVLIRLVTATRPRNPQVAALDRSAYLILHELVAANRPLSVGELADRLKVDLSTMSRQVSAMDGKHLIARRPDPDGARVNVVCATPAGHEQYWAMREARRQTYEQILADWPSRDRAQLARLIQRLNESIRQYQTRTLPSSKSE